MEFQIMSSWNKIRHSMFGKMSDFNIWNYSMITEEMKSWTTCLNNKGGNVVNWETAEWTMHGLEVEEIPNEELCHSGNELAVFASPKRDFETSVNFCKRLGGNLAVSDNFKNADAMVKNGFEWSQTVPNSPKRSQTIPKWSRTLPNCSRQSQIDIKTAYGSGFFFSFS